MDFMETSMNAAQFVVTKLGLNLEWIPRLREQDGMFSDEIVLHASKANQVAWTGMALEFVERSEQNTYVNVDLNGTVRFRLTSDF